MESIIIDINNPSEFLLQYCTSKKNNEINYYLLKDICLMRPHGCGVTTKEYLLSLKNLGRGVVLSAIAKMQYHKGEFTEQEISLLKEFSTLGRKPIYLLAQMQEKQGMISSDHYNKLLNISQSNNGQIRILIMNGVLIMQKGKGMINDEQISAIRDLCHYQGEINTHLFRLLVRHCREKDIPLNGHGYEYIKNRFDKIKDLKIQKTSQPNKHNNTIQQQDTESIEELFGTKKGFSLSRLNIFKKKQ